MSAITKIFLERSGRQRTNNDSPAAPPTGGEIKGYLALASWDAAAARPETGQRNMRIRSFRMTMEVPPPPRDVTGQSIFIFQGLEPAFVDNAPHSILQPVLQWGRSAAGGGDHWSAMSCYVKGSPGNLVISVFSSVRPVESGQRLEGSIKLLKDAEDSSEHAFAYSSEFEGLPETRLLVEIPEELTQAGLALEGYHLRSTDELPSSKRIVFSDVEIVINGNIATPNWSLRSRTELGIEIEVASHGDDKNKIIVKY